MDHEQRAATEMMQPQDHPNSQTEIFDFAAASATAVADANRLSTTRCLAANAHAASQERLAELPSASALRDLAAQIRQHTLDHLDVYLEQFQRNVEAGGGHVHFAADAAEARQIVLDIAKRCGCHRVMMSNSRILAEIGQTDALQLGGIEWIDDRHADLGICGGDFLIAQTGQVCAVEDDDGTRRCMALPRVLISLAGIEQLVPRLADLVVFLKLFARGRGGKRMAARTSLFGRTRSAGEKDGPEEFHLILLDNGRSRILAGAYRDILRCIHCEACLNACPVYRSVGPDAYGSPYSGPIGAVLSPLLFGLDRYRQLPSASTLCGLCADVCPVKINIPEHLLRLRAEVVAAGLAARRERRLYRRWAWIFSSPFLYRVSAWFRRRSLRRRADESGWAFNPDRDLAPWTAARDLPAPPAKSFRQLWKERPKRPH